ncbi:biosynthetic arginine decarboxylase [Pedosphaera parvula]|uniref:Biosynthetic arginine decarboxylase n=1 Tax=Pedosphaera parvula (strain Ellin514) TaxID=320771 RepID=B9XIQ3_PEDPL|nr:biosynthetic arginine decarboxylase [Pedosphaera parvula]EEF60316.1 arginine decarboxylase [Pedosphaera parvula Ellin514]
MSNPIDPAQPWDLQTARSLYNINRWGAKYFDINEAGHVVATPLQEAGASVDITDVIEEAKGRGLKFPVLIRFQDILRNRVESINTAFRNSITEFNYQGSYRGVFPIKVNQLREVVEEILEAGKPFNFGLEVGSKPELFAGLALQNQIGSLIICNGYKDAGFIKMAILGQKLGKKVIMVVEKLEELRQIITISKQLGVEPSVGIRARLHSKGAGKWAESGGENAKFGLSTSELLAATEMLKSEGLGQCFKLLHFHIGSQVPDILTVKKAVQEASRFYAKLFKMGFNIEYMDVGGGLGVDYDGSRSAFDSSTNYTLQEYTNDIVYYVGDVCNAEKVPHPHIISESGRAIVAHHSMLVVEVFGAIEKIRSGNGIHYTENEHPLVKELLDIRKNISKLNKLEAYHDALERKDDAHHMFTLGMLELPDKAKIENLYWDIGQEVVQSFKGQAYIPEEIVKLEDSLGDQYLCNFSVFQSLLDHWALGQLFPIMPLSKLNERPTREGTLVDITCDSDGQINKFIDLRDVRDTLPLHKLGTNGNGQQEPYYIGIFLMGAYQDIMGDLHNLFGRVNEVHVFLDPDEPAGYYVEEIIEGTTIGQALASVQYDENELKRRMKAQIDEAIKSDRMKPSEAMRLLDDYERGLKDYTYLTF